MNTTKLSESTIILSRPI